MSEETQKVPSQIFKWFERMKESYELSIQNTLKRFESYNGKQQERIDTSHNSHVEHLKDINEKQSTQYTKQIEQLHKDVDYYRQQIDKQQTTIDELNTRYDTVLRCMLPNKNPNNIKDIFSEHDFLAPITDSIENDVDVSEHTTTEVIYEKVPTANTETLIETPIYKNSTEVNLNELFDQAILARKSGETTQAFLLFEQAAKLGHVKSMGAMGRSFFLGEGTNEDPCLGLAWLINAANLQHPQAIERVKHFAENEPSLYQEAINKSEHLVGNT